MAESRSRPLAPLLLIVAAATIWPACGRGRAPISKVVEGGSDRIPDSPGDVACCGNTFRRPRPPEDGQIPAVLVVDGYVDKTSYLPGDTAFIAVNAQQDGVARLRLYDLTGAVVDSVNHDFASQPITNYEPWSNGFGYSDVIQYTVPGLKSGLYLWEGSIPMLIRSATAAPIVVVYPTNTINAYNTVGGKSLYQPAGAAAVAVSFQRPVSPPLSPTCEPFLRWMATQSYEAKFIADQDLEDYSQISGAKLLLIIGHSEYWTRVARQNFDRFVASGSSALILSGNNMWWQVRYSDDGTQMICYKSASDPIADPLLKTINWDQASLQYSIIGSLGAEFPLGGYGLNQNSGWHGFKITDASSPIFNGLGLKNGDIISIPSSEYDGAPRTGLDANGAPIIDNGTLGFESIKLLGYDYGFRDVPTVATWIAFRKTSTSGVVINGASTDWTSLRGMGGADGQRITVIIRNMIDGLLSGSMP